jgi:hypothetical protein
LITGLPPGREAILVVILAMYFVLGCLLDPWRWCC